jgi:hypothetical protein
MRLGFLWESHKKKIPLEIPRRRWEDNNKMDITGIGRGGIAWIHLAQDRDQWGAPMNTVINLWVP